ncbi:sphingoid base hydroxylase 2 [Perilla frutescens var. hirtella]|nr:sphingoid base hydroxylase 2 [Perilla frutescens var. hirtella]
MLAMEMMNGVTVSNEMLGTFAPIIVYWIYSGIHILLGSLDDYKLHTRKDEDEKNLVSKRDVAKACSSSRAKMTFGLNALIGRKKARAGDSLMVGEWDP